MALRGGTAHNKLLLAAPARYSEDVDLVQVAPSPIGPVLDAIRARLNPWLGKAAYKQTGAGSTLAYRFQSEGAPSRPLRLKIEINTREQFAVFGHVRLPVTVSNPWFSGGAEVTTFTLEELLATKLRALYQRKKGRDLFDLWLALTSSQADPAKIVQAFVRYRDHEQAQISRALFEKNLQEKLADRTFTDDVLPLLASGVT